MAYVELINQDQSSRINYNDLAIIGRLWSPMQSSTQKGVRLVNCKGFYTPTPELLHPTIAVWPFEAWEIDIIGPISPSSAKGYRFILAITDYFSKWAEVIPLVEVKTTNMVNSIKHHVIHRFCVPRPIIHDNSPQSQVNHSIDSTTSTEFRMWRQLLTTLLLMG